MNERIKQLREQSLNAAPTISLERARLLTDFYRSDIAGRVSVPVSRALALKYIIEDDNLHKSR
jgi:formate C-acetyltransferase